MPTQTVVDSALDHLANDVRRSKDLHELLSNLRIFAHAYLAHSDDGDTESALKIRGVDLCELPTFGGTHPEDTSEVWSWDETSLLVGVGPFSEWRIVERTEIVTIPRRILELDAALLVRYQEALERIAAGVATDPKLIALKALGRA